MPFRLYAIMTNKLLMAIPPRTFPKSEPIDSNNLSAKLDFCNISPIKIKRGTAISTVLVGALLAASTGVVGASVVAMGIISLPVMLKYNYNKELSTGTICAAGTLGQIIPPSIVLIILGDVFQLPVGDVFKAAFIPGLWLVGLYLIYIIVVSFLRKELAPPVVLENRGNKIQQIIKALIDILPPLILIVLVPILLPVADHIGLNPLWFAILIAMNLQTSFLTPPFGFSLFYLKGVSPPTIKTYHIYRGVVPFITIQIIVLLILAFYPQLFFLSSG